MMNEKYDFTNATRGKFYAPNAVFNLPVYLEPDVNEFMSKLAAEKEIDIQLLVNEWLRTNIKLIESAS